MAAQDAAQTSTACERTTAFADSATAAVVDRLADSATKKLNTHTDGPCITVLLLF